LRRRQLAGKSAFDCLQRAINIAGRPYPNGMEMVWQDADGVRFEWQARLDPTINLPQMFDLPDQKLAATISKHNGEKEYPAFDFWALITRHLPIMP